MSWCRNVDFLPIMSMQSKLNQDKEIFYFKGSVSTSKSKETNPIKTELGIHITPSSTDSNKVNVEYGTKIPDVNDILTLKEIWESTISMLPETPDIVIHEEGLIHQIPRNILDGLGT